MLFGGERRLAPVDAHDGPFAEVEAAGGGLGDLGHGDAAGSSRANDCAAALHCKLNAMGCIQVNRGDGVRRNVSIER